MPHVISISLLADLVTIFGIFGFVIAFCDYKNKLKVTRKQELEESLQTVRILKHQLFVMRDWVSFYGEGYKIDERDKWKRSVIKQRGNPLSFVVDIGYEPVTQINLLPGTKYLDEKIIEAASNLNQLLKTYHSVVTEMRDFRSSRGADKNVVLADKIDQGLDLSPEEVNFRDRLLNYQAFLHFNVISDKKHSGLHYWHSQLTELINLTENKLLEDISN